jgi:sugar phosphate isomerase/epimerase
MLTRRDFGVLAAGAFSRGFAAPIESTVNGVMIGAQSYSFRDVHPVNIETCIDAFRKCDLRYCELWSGHLGPEEEPAARQWRLQPPLARLGEIRSKFDTAGIRLYAVNYSFRSDWSDQEFENGFRIAQALGVDKITASANVNAVGRIDDYAKKYKITVGLHNHDAWRPNEFAEPWKFEKAMKGRSRYIAVNLDIGHFTAAGFDPVDFLQKHADRIVTLHIKDRKRFQGLNMPFGQGETPIREVLLLLRDRKYPIPAMIEYEYEGTSDPITEVRKCYDWMKQALA